MKEPETDTELEKAIKKVGYTFHDHGDSFSIKCIEGGAITHLEAEERSDALFEAWNMVKP
jgi:hypothetical protein